MSTGRGWWSPRRDVAFLESIAKVDGNVRKDGLCIRSLNGEDLDEVQGLKDGGWQVADRTDVASNPASTCCAFSFWDMTKLLDLEWRGRTAHLLQQHIYDLGARPTTCELMNG